MNLRGLIYTVRYTGARKAPELAAARPSISAEFPRETDEQGTSCCLRSYNSSDALLQGGKRECLHDLPGWLRLHHAHLSEDLPLASFGGRLRAGLDLEQPGDHEDARLGDLLRGNLAQAADELRALRPLQLVLAGKLLGQGALGHGLGGGLHGRHLAGWKGRRSTKDGRAGVLHL